MQNRPLPHRPPIGLIAGAALLVLIPIIGCMAFAWLQWAALASSYPFVTDTIRISAFLLPVVFGAWGIGTGVTILWRRYGWKESIFADKQAAMMRATKQVAPLATSFTYHDAHQVSAPAQLTASEPASAGLPAALDLAAIAHTPTIDHILLAIDELGQITVSIPDLCHVGLLGSTGGGKSNLLRLIMPQILKIGGKCILADPHFAPLDPENGDDWRPIADRLIHAPAVSAAAIDSELDFMLEELARRLELRRENKPLGPPMFFCYDELPVITDLVSDAPARLGKLLREGRKVSLLTIGASQSMLIKEIGGSSTLRDAYRTVFYAGGDKKSAAAMLDLAERNIDDGPLGKGVVLLRSKATAPARLVRVPLVSNAALYSMLGVQVAPQIAPTEPISNPLQTSFGFAAMATARNGIETAPKPVAETGNVALGSDIPTAEHARILALFRSGKSTADIVRELYGTITGTPYQKRRAEIEAVIRAAMMQGVK